MNSCLVFLAVLALTGAATVNGNPVEPLSSLKGVLLRAHSNELLQVIDEFTALLPKEKVQEILLYHLLNDEGIGEAYGFLQSTEYKNLVKKADGIEDLRIFYDYLEEAGLDVYAIVHQSAGLPTKKPEKRVRRSGVHGGADSYIADIKAIVPKDKVKALHKEKLETSPAFAHFVEYLLAPRYQEIIDALRANSQFKEVLAIFNEGGINVEAVVDLYATILGF